MDNLLVSAAAGAAVPDMAVLGEGENSSARHEGKGNTSTHVTRQ